MTRQPEQPATHGRPRASLLVLQRHLPHADGLTCENAADRGIAVAALQGPDVRLRSPASTCAVAVFSVKSRAAH